MEGYTYGYVNGTDIHLYRRKEMFHANISTVLLAQFTKAKEEERILDIGTNSGALLFVVHCYAPSYLHSIGIQPEAIATAGKNIEHHHVTNMMPMAQDMCGAALEKMDVIICSLSYFKMNQESNLNES